MSVCNVCGKLTVRAAASAIGIHHDTLKKRLLAAGHEVKPSSKFTLRQVFNAMQMDPSQARARESTERAMKYERERLIDEGRLKTPQQIDDAIRAVLLPMRQKVWAVDDECSHLCTDPDAALEVLHKWKLRALETVFKSLKDEPEPKSS